MHNLCLVSNLFSNTWNLGSKSKNRRAWEVKSKFTMNKLQADLADVIWALTSTKNFHKKVRNSAIRYGYLNYVAKYSLAKDQYFISENALRRLNDLNLLTDRGLLRGSKSRARAFTYEHPIPSNVIADEILKHADTKEAMIKILERSDCVTVLTDQENKRLKGSLVGSMPQGWSFFGSSPFERYRAAELPDEQGLKTISVYGAVAR